MLKLFRYDADGPRLGVETSEGRFDLTTVDRTVFSSIAAWLATGDPVRELQRAATRVLEAVPDDCLLLPPVDLQEVWAAGVTYERSKVARMEESEGGGDFYDKVYLADRPELFMKAVGWRVVGPGQAIRIRRDSTWNVPEPELTLVVSPSGSIVGLTVGNDVSSRSIEGENPLYLPQAKCYDSSCALGPAILLNEEGVDLSHRTIQLQIEREGKVVFAEETSTARMKRQPGELADYLFRELSFPQGALLMTGTGLVPPDSFTLQRGDIVAITISGVGTLINPVA